MAKMSRQVSSDVNVSCQQLTLTPRKFRYSRAMSSAESALLIEYSRVADPDYRLPVLHRHRHTDCKPKVGIDSVRHVLAAILAFRMMATVYHLCCKVRVVITVRKDKRNSTPSLMT